MKINKKKFIYLISPNTISLNFYKDLQLILKSGNISFFQMRFKKYSSKKKILIGKKIKKICTKNKVKLIINDDPFLTLKIDADGCHLGQKDMNLTEARKILKKKLIGITCHNSTSLAKKAKINGADYIAFGSFYPTKTKKVKYYADLNLLQWGNKKLRLPIVAIGGINDSNYKILINNGANLIAMSGSIWRKKIKIKNIKYLKPN